MTRKYALLSRSGLRIGSIAGWYESVVSLSQWFKDTGHLNKDCRLLSQHAWGASCLYLSTILSGKPSIDI